MLQSVHKVIKVSKSKWIIQLIIKDKVNVHGQVVFSLPFCSFLR